VIFNFRGTKNKKKKKQITDTKIRNSVILHELKTYLSLIYECNLNNLYYKYKYSKEKIKTQIKESHDK